MGAVVSIMIMILMILKYKLSIVMRMNHRILNGKELLKKLLVILNQEAKVLWIIKKKAAIRNKMLKSIRYRETT